MNNEYSVNDLFDSNSAQYNGAVTFNTPPPSAQKTGLDGVGPATLVAGELQGNTTVQDGYLQSGNFVTGVSGWKIDADGDAEFQSVTIAGVVLRTIGTFGGDGSDGALSITSGTTTVDLGGASYVVKNYSSISITGTGKLAFSNPAATGTIIVLKSKGDVTLTSSQAPMIDASGTGTAGGTGTSTSGTVTQDGNPGNAAVLGEWTCGAPGAGVTAGAQAAGGVVSETAIAGRFSSDADLNVFNIKYRYAFKPSSGGSGAILSLAPGSGTLVSGAGGRGGGTLIIECGGAWNFTTTAGISVAGQDGFDGSGTHTRANVGGGGGGGGGYFLALYNTLTANSGTITKSGGVGGAAYNNETAGPTAFATGFSGGGGGSTIADGGASSGTETTSVGGTGAVGFSLVAKNTFYA